jgi:hypothetical protein
MRDIYTSLNNLMQKLINVLAVVSFAVSAGIVAGGTYVYLEKDNLVESVKENITKEIEGIVGGALVGGLNSGVPEVPGVESGGTGLPSLPF